MSSTQAQSVGSEELQGKEAQQPNDHGAPQKDVKKAPILKRLWQKLDLDVPTIMMMFKGSLPPTIALAMYQSDAVADHYTTLGYLIAIMSVLGFAIMPRGKFLQTMALNVITSCFAAALNMLAMWSAVKARQHTLPPNPTPTQATGYNASQSAVCAIWLCFQVYCVNVIRVLRPQFQFPAIIFSIFAIVSMSYGAAFPTVDTVESFIKRLLETFLTGFGLATAVSLFIFPVSSRKVVFKEMAGYMKLLSGTMKAQTAYMHSLESIDIIANRKKLEESTQQPSPESHHKGHRKPPRFEPMSTPALAALKQVAGKLLALHSKMQMDLTPAKRDFAWGKLDAKNISEICRLLRAVFIPVIGITSMSDLLERRAQRAQWETDDIAESLLQEREQALQGLHWTMAQMREPFSAMTESMALAFTHVAVVLGFEKASSADPDLEQTGDVPTPGSRAFADAFSKSVDRFHTSKHEQLRKWCEQRGIELPEDFAEPDFKLPDEMRMKDESLRDKYRNSLFFVLYLEYLVWRAGLALLDLVRYVDTKREDGTLAKNKLILPGSKRLYKWFKSTFQSGDLTNEDNILTDINTTGSDLIYIGGAFTRSKDPEHLMPENAFERLGEMIRLIPIFFRKEASAFGLRVVAATMTVAIVGYLEDTQRFFIRQRLLWAEIMIAISMNRMAGQSTFNFVLRVLGTVVAMIGSYIVWYIVDGHRAGVIVFLWLWMTLSFYIVLKMPKFVIIGILSIVTAVLIVGYELQVDKIGVALATSNDQPAYHLYELAPYRLACVAGGLFVAYIWTIFPYPISEGTEMRKDLGAAVYLLANFYAITHETVQSRIKGTDGALAHKTTHVDHLDKARMAAFSKIIALLNQVKENFGFSRFQVRVGGKFPHDQYKLMTDCIERILLFIALMSYASSTYSANEAKSKWSTDFRKTFSSISGTSHDITSLLILLSSSLKNSQPLPSRMHMPPPYELIKKLQEIDDDILSVRHIAEPEYSALAVIQLCSHSVSQELATLTNIIQDLVGVIDFTFHAADQGDSTSTLSSARKDDKNKSD
ncbi:hypothetical protein K431DRAFT_316508 [Polychaeton citri CBS 116435]|uniref:ER transporter 6TM N-terminal domain-containing protein n=1 Tax=Polychaeton citri CBS 116435 TaxID=1314669 RepID=A0A9P4PZ47_9PEZI|nr:hypothetical protein K431DRAFT_316508 [Polychaeton citri CBS 116435]